MRLPSARSAIEAAFNRHFGIFITLLIWVAVLVVAQAGGFRPVDDALRDLRFSFEQRQPSGNVVFVDIDSRSIEAAGVWPWPRSIHAELLDKLMALDVSNVAFDVDFSSPSTEEEDARFEQSLKAAGGFAVLAAFRQQDRVSGSEAVNLPLERFREYADPVVVNVAVDRSGVVRTYPYAMELGGDVYPTLASAFSGETGPAGAHFNIDYGIWLNGIDHVAAVDVLEGRIDPSRLSGKQVVIGASALELRDYFQVPRYGMIPGAAVQIMAIETLMQGRAMADPALWPTVLLVLLVGGIASVLAERVGLLRAFGAALMLSALVEGTAFVLQARTGILIDTAAAHFAQAGFLIRALLLEIESRRKLHVRAARERDSTQGILDRVIADNFDGVIVVARDGEIIAASNLAEEILGTGLKGRRAAEVIPRGMEAEIEQVLNAPAAVAPAPRERLFSQNGQNRTIEYAITRSDVVVGDGVASAVACLTFRDITERRQSEEKLKFLASHDPLTGALSRSKLIEMIDQELSTEAGRVAGVNVVLIDLRRFKTVNDTLGHSYGDMVLRQAVGRLKSAGGDAVARMGGDSFALLLIGERSPSALQAYSDGLLRRISAPYLLADGHQAIVSGSAGATTSGVSGYDAEVLLAHADMALSAANDLPGGMSQLFAPEMDNRLKERQEMDAALRLAVVRNELSITFQPQVNLDTGELVGAEALVRWVHPDLGPVSPGRFIPAAEESGQIIEISRWVLDAACKEVATWPGHVRVAINVSPIQFDLTDVVADVRVALERSGLPPHRLDLELTEGIFMSQSGPVMQQLETLRRLGVGIALDDFGTGYSSLSYLGRLPVDKIKIDQGFVKGLPADQEFGAIIRAVMTLSETLNKVVVAEGIETADQAWMLKMMGCKIGQGYYFGRPVSAAEMRELLSQPPKPVSGKARKRA